MYSPSCDVGARASSGHRVVDGAKGSALLNLSVAFMKLSVAVHHGVLITLPWKGVMSILVYEDDRLRVDIYPESCITKYTGNHPLLEEGACFTKGNKVMDLYGP